MTVYKNGRIVVDVDGSFEVGGQLMQDLTVVGSLPENPGSLFYKLGKPVSGFSTNITPGRKLLALPTSERGRTWRVDGNSLYILDSSLSAFYMDDV